MCKNECEWVIEDSPSMAFWIEENKRSFYITAHGGRGNSYTMKFTFREPLSPPPGLWERGEEGTPPMVGYLFECFERIPALRPVVALQIEEEV